MKKKKNLEKWAGVFVVALFVLSATSGIVIENVYADSQYIDLQVSRWIDEDLVIANESWLQEDYDEFLDDLEVAENSSANWTVIGEAVVSVYIEYGLVPENKSLDDLFEFLEEQYNENEELIEDFYDEYGFGDIETHYSCLLKRKPWKSAIYATPEHPFICRRIPGLIYILNGDYGGKLNWRSYGDGESGLEVQFPGDFKVVLVIWLGVFELPLHWGPHIFTREFSGATHKLMFALAT